MERDGEGCLAQLRSPGLHPLAKGIMWAFELRSMGQARPVASGMKSRLKGRRGQRPVRARAKRGQEARGWEEQDPRSSPDMPMAARPSSETMNSRGWPRPHAVPALPSGPREEEGGFAQLLTCGLAPTVPPCLGLFGHMLSTVV